MTNYEKIKAMSAEEMEEKFSFDMDCGCCPMEVNCTTFQKCEKLLKEKLLQETYDILRILIKRLEPAVEDLKKDEAEE